MILSGGALRFVLAGVSLGWLGSAALLQQPQKSAAQRVNFGRDILPILSDKCFKCHGPDAGSRMANMRLDTPQGAFADRGGRWPIVPGKPQDSLVVKRIHSADDPMPPAFSGKTLTDQEKDLITRWIAEGAVYGKLWSFEPLPKRVAVPAVNGKWARCDLDRFILDRLNKEGLTPTAEAPKSRWLRRVTLDLTGLPPTEKEIADFNKDGSYEKVADRLLASPHFGERAAVDWLDAARYGDSYGYQADLLMPSWPYRDWVVKAFNDNMPYDHFVVDQVAGDLLPNATRDQRLATAFNRLHRQSNEGGSITLEYKTEYAVDRVSTFGTAVLGLTVGCARCHDHKFDPISQKEFYQLFAYFNSIDEYGLYLSSEVVPTPTVMLPTPEQDARLEKAKAQDSAAKARLANAQKAVLAPPGGAPRVTDAMARVDFEQPTLTNRVDNGYQVEYVGKPALVPGKSGQGIQLDGDDGLVFRGLPSKDRWEPFTWCFWVSDPERKGPVVVVHRTGGTDVGFCGFDLLLEDGYLTARVFRHWPGNAVAVRTIAPIAKDVWHHVGWSWDGSGQASGLKLYVNGAPAATTVLRDRLWKKIDAYGDLGPSGGDWSFGQRFRDAGFKGGKLDEIEFVPRVLTPAEICSECGQSEPTAAEMKDYSIEVDASVQAAHKAVRKAQEALANAEEGVLEVECMEETKEPVAAYLLARGQYDAPRTDATRVQRGTPASLPPLKLAGSNDRLALARWATEPDQPLTARVAVNRLWQMVFGVGLVETSENFGIQGSRPTHPELLDYLARRFVNSRWDVKKMLREMVLSATYRQDSVRTKKLNDVDPLNHLYARGPSIRLSAEMVRDTALAAAGLLNAKMGGPPVNAYQPANIWTENNGMTPSFNQSVGVDLYRRSLYSTWKRTTPVPSMMMFDATSREACTMRRPATNTPLQALVLLNDVQYVEAARALAELAIKRESTDAARIGLAFLRLSGRSPDAAELSILQRTLAEQRGLFAGDVASARKLVAVGDSKADASLSPSELAAMTVTVQAILSSDAVIWKR